MPEIPPTPSAEPEYPPPPAAPAAPSAPAVPAAAPAAAQPVAAPAGGENPYAVKTPMGRAVLFTILSFVLWTIYWFYKNRRLLDGELADGRDDSTMHTFGLFVPVLGYFIVYWLYRDLSYLRTRYGLPEFSVPGFLVAAILLGPLGYAFVLKYFNEYWDVRTNGAAVDSQVTGGEKAIVGIGIGLFVLYILFFVLIIIAVGVSSS